MREPTSIERKDVNVNAPTYHSKEWRAKREQILLRDLWICQMCGVGLIAGKVKPTSAVVDHLQPVLMAPDLFFDGDNLWSVCKGCHDNECRSIEFNNNCSVNIKSRKKDYRPIGVDGYPIDVAEQLKRFTGP